MTVLDCRLDAEHDGSFGYPSESRYHHTWTVMVDDQNMTAFDVLGSAVLTALGLTVGQPYWGWVCTSAGNGIYAKQEGTAKDPHSALVMLDPRRDPDNPLVFRLHASYEGVRDPLAELPDVTFGEIPYQENTIIDVTGEVRMNSALDPYRDGMPVDKVRTSLVIERPIGYTSLNPKVLEESFKNTLNFHPFQLPAPLADQFGQPIVYPQGTGKITSITFPRRARAKVPVGSTPAATFYWMARVQVDFDLSTVVDGYGRKQYVRWREVKIDAGYHERRSVTKDLTILGVPVTSEQSLWRINMRNGQPATEEQLLDGSGRKLVLPGAMPEYPKIAAAAAGLPIANHNFYSTYLNTRMDIDAPGVMGNDQDAAFVEITSSPTHASAFTLYTDGSFTYTPVTNYVGWDTFRYRPGNATGWGQEATVMILVGPRPHVRFNNKYHLRDWNPIAFLLGGW